jgi:NAD(P)-dependent dehydrogenase (short-subunit alcohol dehydrogenase family)
MNLAIITGGSKGLGKALADLFVANQWQVLELSRSGSGAAHFSLDLTNLDARFEALQEKFQTLASMPWERVVLVNNAAAVMPIGLVHLLSDSAICSSLDINVQASIRIIAAFVRCFQAQPGQKSIANVSSGAALNPFPGWSLYCAGKAALEMFMLTLAREQQRCAHPISCFNFGPGVIDTGMQAQIRSSAETHFPDVQRFIHMFESGQLRNADAVGRALFQLCSGAPENGRRYTVDEFDGVAD